MSASFAVAWEGVLAEASAKEVIKVHPSLGSSTAAKPLPVSGVGKQSFASRASRKLSRIVGSGVGEVERGDIRVLVRGLKGEAVR